MLPSSRITVIQLWFPSLFKAYHEFPKQHRKMSSLCCFPQNSSKLVFPSSMVTSVPHLDSIMVFSAKRATPGAWYKKLDVPCSDVWCVGIKIPMTKWTDGQTVANSIVPFLMNKHLTVVMSVLFRECPQWTLSAPYGDPLQCCMCFRRDLNYLQPILNPGGYLPLGSGGSTVLLSDKQIWLYCRILNL